MSIGPTEITLIVLVIILLFGASKLPELARGTGSALRIFKTETKGLLDDDTDSDSVPGGEHPPRPITQYGRPLDRTISFDRRRRRTITTRRRPLNRTLHPTDRRAGIAMTRQPKPGPPRVSQPVLVAVDGGNESLEAVAWAVAEAAARQTSLTAAARLPLALHRGPALRGLPSDRHLRRPRRRPERLRDRHGASTPGRSRRHGQHPAPHRGPRPHHQRRRQPRLPSSCWAAAKTATHRDRDADQ